MRKAMDSLYKLVDIGANLSHPSFQNDYADVLNRAKKAGIIKLMITGASESITEDASRLASQEPGFLYYTAGVHPHDAKDFVEGRTLDVLRSHLAENRQCVAVGECGLDFNRNFSTRDQQIRAFEAQVQLACELGKPLFVHEREASPTMIEILGRYSASLPPTVIHCFTGTVAEARHYMEMGLYIGLTGFLWKDRAEDGVKRALRERTIRIDRLLLETDAPFMYPKLDDKKLDKDIRKRITAKALELHQHSNFKRNEPSSLAAICELIAAYMDYAPAELANATTENARRVFGLDILEQYNDVEVVEQ
uniref:Deoxyribonuclease TATDN1 n=1 Tax=Globodera rostochiensis TaxID=31243 RepID=A0A914I568_GLORO